MNEICIDPALDVRVAGVSQTSGQAPERRRLASIAAIRVGFSVVGLIALQGVCTSVIGSLERAHRPVMVSNTTVSTVDDAAAASQADTGVCTR